MGPLFQGSRGVWNTPLKEREPGVLPWKKIEISVFKNTSLKEKIT
jgi:hypothetical protein